MAEPNSPPQPTTDGTPAPTGTNGEKPDAAERARLDALTRLAWDTYYRDLPQLLEERPGQWVVYHGDQRLGFGKNPPELYQQCFQRGLKRGEFWVFCIEPLMPEPIAVSWPSLD